VTPHAAGLGPQNLPSGTSQHRRAKRPRNYANGWTDAPLVTRAAVTSARRQPHAELGGLNVADALDLTLLIREVDTRRYERALRSRRKECG
jgi:hypothetical protein